MALQHNPYQPESQLMQFHPNALPFLINVQLPQQIQNLLPIIQATVMNELTGRSGMNQARMYTFNMVSSRNWQNPYFAELVQMAGVAIFMAMVRGQAQAPEMVIDQLCGQAVGLYVSKVLLENQDLKSITDHSVTSAAMQNVPALNQMLNDLRGSTSPQFQQNGWNNNGGMQPMNNQMNFRQPMTPNYQAGMQSNLSVQSTIGGRSTSPFNQNNNQASGSMFQQQQGTVPEGAQRRYNNGNDSPVQQSNFFKGRQPQQQEVVEEVQQDVELTKDDWKPSDSQPYRIFVDQRFFDKEYVRIGEDVVEMVNPKGNTMDREKHTITMLGRTYNMSGLLRTGMAADNVAGMATITPEDIHNVANDTAEIERQAEVMEYIYPKMQVDLFLDTAIFQGRLLQLKHQQDGTKNNVYRTYSTIFTPMLTIENNRRVLENLCKSKHTRDLASKIRDWGKQLTEQSKSGDVEACESLAVYLNSIDRSLTDRVNSFLKNNLMLETRIGSFTEDTEEIYGYLDRKYGQRYAAAYQQFEFNMIGNMISSLDPSVEKDLVELLDVDANQQAVSFIPVTYSFTYLNVISNELGLDKLGDETCLIREAESPLLFKIAESLYNQRSGLDIQPAYDLLITQDQQIFRLYKGYLGNEAYLIGR